MANWSMQEALRFALKAGGGELREYEKSAKEAANPASGRLFLFLADEERRHIKADPGQDGAIQRQAVTAGVH